MTFETSMLSVILKQLEIAAFQWNKDDDFTPINELPDWFSGLYNKRMARSGVPTNFHLANAFPFIENFLYDAEKLWSQSTDGQLHSGLWTEITANDVEFYIEAVAINALQTPVLLFTNETTNFDVRHKVFQTARNLALQNEQLENVVQLHQRKLQQQLESFCQPQVSLTELSDNIQEESSAVLICRQDGAVELYNRALVDIYSLNDEGELERQSLLEKWVKEAERIYPEIHRVLAVGKHWEGEFETSDNGETKKWIRLMIAPIVNEDQNEKIIHYICIANDISESRISLEEVERLTQIDPTTRLPNRRNFWSYLSTQIDQKKLQGGNLALFYVDLDHFKQINDGLGPEQADFVLNTVASRLKRCLKTQDYVAHLGADEFAVVATDYGKSNALPDMAQRIIEGIYRDVSFNELTINVSASVGIAVYPRDGANARQIVKSADFAMYHAKEMGRNQFQLFGPGDIRDTVSKLHIEQGLKNAIEKREFELLYQPQICIGQKSIHRAEALIRWNHPEHGLIAPASFISIAEDSGLIIDIGRWVIETACEELQRLASKNINVKISVNVSPKQFKYSNLADDIIKNLKAYKVEPSQLELEVTESAFMDNMDSVVEQLETIRKLGVSISLDDFGTGYSSLSYLKNLPVDQLKIDRSFIIELPDNRNSKTIVESLIKLAHELSIEVIAEGIENQRQLEYLKALNCDYFQGYFFHAPLSASELLTAYESVSIKKS
jgi:diguanylate cyclase (GGDEF)-like protein